MLLNRNIRQHDGAFCLRPGKQDLVVGCSKPLAGGFDDLVDWTPGILSDRATRGQTCEKHFNAADDYPTQGGCRLQ